MASPQRRVEIQSWLDKARCRLSKEDYSRFREYVKTLKTLKDGGCDGQNILKELAELLWQAHFPEGPYRQQEWLIAFRQSLPVVARGFWHNVVVKTVPLLHPASQLHESARRPREAWQETSSDCSVKTQLEPSVLPSGISPATTDVIPTVVSKDTCANATERRYVDTVDVEKTKPDEPRNDTWKASVAAFEVISRRIPWRPPSQERQLDDNGNSESRQEDKVDTSTGGQSGCLLLDGIEKDCQVVASPRAILDASDSNILGDPACSRKRLREEEVEELAQEVVKLRQRLVCVFCRDFPSSPMVSAVCGHFGCRECWSSWMVCRFECPVCRAKARPQNLIRLRGFDG